MLDEEDESKDESTMSPELEAKFREAVKDANKRINKALKKAKEYLAKAEAISKETGIPFSTNFGYASYDTFVAAGTSAKWKDVDPNLFEELTDMCLEDLADEEGGWQSSYC